MAVRAPAINFGSALNFTGSSRVTTAYTPSLSAFSCAFWVNRKASASSQKYVDWQDAGPIKGFRINQFGGFENRIEFQLGSGANPQVFSKFIPFNTWTHIVCTYSFSGGTATIRIYQDGVLIQTNTDGTQMLASAQALCIGNRATSFTNPALSTMDEVLFYDSELTQSQITSIFTGAGPVASPRAYYKFNENAGTTTTDLSGNGFTGTITSPSWVSSKTTRTTSTTRTTATNRVVVRDMGTALDTFASSGYVAIGTGINAAINSANAYTFAQWVKRGPVKGTLQSFMGAPGGDKAWFNFLADNSVRLYNQDLTPPTVNTLAAQRTITDQNWHLMVGTFDGNTRRIYIDGLAQTTSTATSTGTLNLTGTFYVAAFISGNNFRGRVDSASIWSRALTATEIANLYFNNVVPRNGLVAEYLFNEASGSTALDTSGNGNNGTITGATYTTDVPLRPRTSV